MYYGVTCRIGFTEPMSSTDFYEVYDVLECTSGWTDGGSLYFTIDTVADAEEAFTRAGAVLEAMGYESPEVEIVE